MSRQISLKRHPSRREQYRRYRLMPGYDKLLPSEIFIPRSNTAIQRAEELELRHLRNNTPNENPSTGVFRLIERLLRERQVR